MWIEPPARKKRRRIDPVTATGASETTFGICRLRPGPFDRNGRGGLLARRSDVEADGPLTRRQDNDAGFADDDPLNDTYVHGYSKLGGEAGGGSEPKSAPGDAHWQ